MHEINVQRGPLQLFHCSSDDDNMTLLTRLASCSLQHVALLDIGALERLDVTLAFSPQPSAASACARARARASARAQRTEDDDDGVTAKG